MGGFPPSKLSPLTPYCPAATHSHHKLPFNQRARMLLHYPRAGAAEVQPGESLVVGIFSITTPLGAGLPEQVLGSPQAIVPSTSSNISPNFMYKGHFASSQRGWVSPERLEALSGAGSLTHLLLILSEEHPKALHRSQPHSQDSSLPFSSPPWQQHCHVTCCNPARLPGNWKARGWISAHAHSPRRPPPP